MSDAGTGSALAGGEARRGRDDDERGPGRIRRIGTFYRQVIAELRKVIWPTRRELVTYTAVVLVFVFFMLAIVAAYDFVFSQGVLAVFGE